MLRIDRVLETALYVHQMGRAIGCYQRMFGFPVLLRSLEPDRLTAHDVGGAQALLLCKKGAPSDTVVTPGGNIPPCDGSGNSHLAFPIAASQLLEENWLLDNGIAIESKVKWERAAKASISAILMETCWSWLRQACGQPTKLVLLWRPSK